MVCTILAIIPVGWSQIDISYGQFCFEQAHDRVRQGDLKAALAFFRTAVRHNNMSELYWNDLGVTEMRLGEYAKARRRFVKSQFINPEYDAARDNLRDITNYMKSQGIRLETKDAILQHKMFAYRHAVSQARIIRGEDIDDVAEQLSSCQQDEVLNGEARPSCSISTESSILSEPFVIRNFVSSQSVLSFFNLQNIRSLYGDLRVDYYPQNMIEESSHPFFLSLDAAVEQLAAPKEVFHSVDVSEPGSYVQLNLDLDRFRSMTQNAQLPIPRLFNDEEMWARKCFNSADHLLSHFYLRHHWKMLLIGAEKASMFAHQDLLRASSYQIQLKGTKRWHLCSGNQSQYLYHPGDVNLFQPDYAQYPKVKQAKCVEATVGPGDLIYYPGDYWHQTLNQESPTISISSTIVLPADRKILSSVLQNQCDEYEAQVRDQSMQSDNDAHYSIIESEVCKIITTKCFDEWRSIFP